MINRRQREQYVRQEPGAGPAPAARMEREMSSSLDLEQDDLLALFEMEYLSPALQDGLQEGSGRRPGRPQAAGRGERLTRTQLAQPLLVRHSSILKAVVTRSIHLLGDLGPKTAGRCSILTAGRQVGTCGTSSVNFGGTWVRRLSLTATREASSRLLSLKDGSKYCRRLSSISP